jgi:hypothetical protein
MEEQDQGLMASFEAEAHSFVLRIWREHRSDPTTPAEWRGWVDHVQSGQRHYFRAFEDIAHIIAMHVSDPADQVFMPMQPKGDD